jgi:Tfp pilus assembly ATPase PilU
VLATGSRLGQVDDARGDDRVRQPELNKHIITIEDPIEFQFEDKRSIVNQREIGSDVRLPAALRRRCGSRRT